MTLPRDIAAVAADELIKPTQSGLEFFVLGGFYLNSFWQRLSKFYGNFRRGGNRFEQTL
jgi:hypothetical protein